MKKSKSEISSIVIFFTIVMFFFIVLLGSSCKAQTPQPTQDTVKSYEITRELNRRNFSDDMKVFKETVKAETDTLRVKIDNEMPKVKELAKSFVDYLKR
jgi:hypothetical protein